ncbi:exopolysaccharide biosynthesis protein [Aureimonas flava]|uniref:Exopolysaccharide biosynthesis protein n=1 Tax=Aureimonas flava TaxID=2320271 RepID=A0A3A1WL45_9HYPH|nr:exopolysaccharide biosynthesis protein [Aureimonas flava]RIY01492.1 exopolysaccharide biosynthesis protein [Aureimonas flava]
MTQPALDDERRLVTAEVGGVGATLDELERVAAEGDAVTLRTIVEAFDARSYGPFLLVPALLEMSPIGGVPGLPTLIASIVVLFAAQILLGRETMWLPGIVGRRSVASAKFLAAVRWLRPGARFMDRWFRGRLTPLTRGPFLKDAAVACILLCLTVPPLELVPFASTAPMAAIAAFGLAILVRDGALMVLAYALTALAFGVGFRLWTA